MSHQIGVDGGGSKTEFILLDPAGAIRARHTAPGCNPSHAGPDRARAILADGLRALVGAQPSAAIGRLLLCMAGSRAFWRETAAGLSGYGRVETADDSAPVLELATGGAPGLALHAGTGSFVAARAPDGSLHYAGGLGWRFGDPASGHDLGRRAVARTLLELQGWAGASPLGRAVQAHAGANDAAALSRIFYAGSDANVRIAALAPIVLELAARDDATARTLLADSLHGLAELARAVALRLFPATAKPTSRIPLGLSGPILTQAVTQAQFAQAAREWLENFTVFPLADPPIEGVRRLLLRNRG